MARSLWPVTLRDANSHAQPSNVMKPSAVTRSFICCWLMVCINYGSASAQLPFERAPIAYSKTEPVDAVAELGKRIRSGQVKLQYDPEFGYLKSLVKELQLPVDSQTLVFAKNSLQRIKISPSNPRAIYFNDQTYLGYVPEGDLIEIASVDSMLGTVFYTLSQKHETDPPTLQRKTEQCLFCHASSHTGRVPGLMMQSVFSDSNGYRVFPQDSIFPQPTGPLSGRWAGWFVTGTHGDQRHLGNLMIDSDDVILSDSELRNGNVVQLSRWIDSGRYLSQHSDLVALLVLQHQVTVHNRLTDANHRARLLLFDLAARNRELGQESGPLTEEDLFVLNQIAEDLVDALLMVDPVVFSGPVSGTSEFAKRFAGEGPRDSKGRSLRSLDLRQTLFTYPCSYLIYSDSFDALPQELLDSVYRQLIHVLRSNDQVDKYKQLTRSKRVAVLEILSETKPGFKMLAGRVNARHEERSDELRAARNEEGQ